MATSVDGRNFVHDVPVDGLDLRVGGYVVIDEGRFGYVTGVALVPDDRSAARIEGRVLDGSGDPFGEAETRVASPGEVAGWLEQFRRGRTVLDVGELTYADGVPFGLDATAFDRHTFLCGQSGSGKTYALGTILERLLAETSLRIVVLDPNSDFVRLAELREDVADEAAERYAPVAAGVDVRRGRGSGDERLHVRFRDFDAAERAAVLRLDPIDDRDEYAALTEAMEDSASLHGTVRDAVDRLFEGPEPLHSLGVRARNLGVDRWAVWSGNDPDSLQDLVQPGGPRCLIADLGSLETQQEQTIAAESVLASLWRRRGAREPTLIVIDEAHNVCPGVAADPLTALATEHAVRIAGEGRKFGLVLLVSTQRPQKLHENVTSQCDNLILMRMNSRSDLALLAETFSFVPSPVLALATEFGQGESVAAGKLLPSPTLGRFGPRWSQEGGADLQSDWATTPP